MHEPSRPTVPGIVQPPAVPLRRPVLVPRLPLPPVRPLHGPHLWVRVRSQGPPSPIYWFPHDRHRHVCCVLYSIGFGGFPSCGEPCRHRSPTCPPHRSLSWRPGTLLPGAFYTRAVVCRGNGWRPTALPLYLWIPSNPSPRPE